MRPIVLEQLFQGIKGTLEGIACASEKLNPFTLNFEPREARDRSRRVSTDGSAGLPARFKKRSLEDPPRERPVPRGIVRVEQKRTLLIVLLQRVDEAL